MQMKPTICLDRLEQEDESLVNLISRSFSAISLSEDFDKSKAIFIKPNLTYPTYKKGVTTRVEFVDSLVHALRRINSTTTIYIGEGEGGYNSFSMTEAMKTMGFHKIEEKYPNVKIANISKLPSRTIDLEAKGKPYSIDVPAIFFDEIDFSISCPLPKVHAMTGITLSMKNQWGCLPDTMRLKNHFVFDEIIGQICKALKFRYAFLDGKYGLDTNGPMAGDTVEVGWFAASNSLGAFDMIVSEMMGFDWKKIRHLKFTQKYGLMPKRQDISIIGNMKALKRNFVLKRTFWNYSALAAFHSNRLTHLFYFSRISKLLHDVMYTFRKRPI